MSWIGNGISLMGFAMFAAGGTFLVYLMSHSIALRRANWKQFRSWQQQQRAQLDQRHQITKKSATESATAPRNHEQSGAWQGWRRFRVTRARPETSDATSVWLTPVDGRAIMPFLPGQYLTIQLRLPKSEKSIIRCYSLSDAFSPQSYRITVKKKPMPEEAIVKSASHFINQSLMVGDLVELKQPAGDFCLESDDPSPLVLLAAGVGVTPMMSMIQTVLQGGTDRTILLAYGNLNSEAVIFRDELRQLQQTGKIHVLHCFSKPLPTDRKGVDFQVEGYLTVDVLKQILPNQKFRFFMCGPPPFMDSMYQGLIQWGVPESRIHFEAFGPATVKKSSGSPTAKVTDRATETPSIVFHTSDGEVEGEAILDTILDIAEELRVELNSGCRSGNCGTCAIKLLKGRVDYPNGPPSILEPGQCLACVAKPVGHVEVEV